MTYQISKTEEKGCIKQGIAPSLPLLNLPLHNN